VVASTNRKACIPTSYPIDGRQEQAQAASIAGVVIVGCRRSAYRQNGALVRLEIKSGRVTRHSEKAEVSAQNRIRNEKR
jgi:hypothetical protein